MESEAIKSCFVNKMDYTQMARIILSSCIIRKRVRYVYRIECNFRVIKMPTHSEDKCAADDHLLLTALSFCPPPPPGSAPASSAGLRGLAAHESRCFT